MWWNTLESGQRRRGRVGLFAVVVAMLAAMVGVFGPSAATSADDHLLFDLFDGDAPSDDWQNTYLLSLLSLYVYNSELNTDDDGFEDAIRTELELIGLDDVRQVQDFTTALFDVESVVAETDDAFIVTFRGTEFLGPNALDWVDVLVDATFVTDLAGAHLGFKTAALAVEQVIRDELDDAGDKKIWLTGHSLGGAMAQMLGYLLRDDYDIQGLVTFGEPQIFKVGIDSGLYITHPLDAKTELWVNSYDPIPHAAGIADNVANLVEFSVNPFLFTDNLVGIIFQYLHVGQRHHIDIDDSGGCTVDTEFPSGVDLVNLDITLADHSLQRYATRILNLMPADERLELVSIATPAGSLVENPPLPDNPVADCDEAPNRPPSADAGGPYTVAEGDAVTLGGSGSDPNGDALDFAWDLDGDGTFETPAASPSFSAAGLDGPSSQTVWLEVTDPDGLTDVDEAVVNVTNAAPSVSAGLDRSVAEGSTLSLGTLAFSDPGVPDTHTASVDWGDGTASQAGTVVEVGGSGVVTFPTHVYADNGAHTVTVCVADDDGDQGCDTAGVTVSNVAPVVEAGSSQTVAEGSTISLASSFGDAGTLDTHTATVNWGDGTPTEPATVTESPFGPPGSTAGMAGTLSGSHVYADNGSYTVTVCVTDDDGATHCDTFTATVSNVAPTANIDTIGDGPDFFLPHVEG
jgi:hypothetical protein